MFLILSFFSISLYRFVYLKQKHMKGKFKKKNHTDEVAFSKHLAFKRKD